MFFYSESMKHKHIVEAAYYSVTVSTSNNTRLFQSNNERAYLISQLQDLLSMRSLLETPLPHSKFANHIDLLAYSLLPYSAQFILFSISKESALEWARIVTERLFHFDSGHRSFQPERYLSALSITRLVGPHDALANTVQLHLNHSDWEFDRYSSIGFYLHDRRGDWMRLWRLSCLYDNQVSNYRQLLTAALQRRQATPHTETVITDDQFAPLTHE